MKNAKAQYAIILIACCLMAGGSAGLAVNAVGVFFTDMASDLGVSSSAASFQATLMISVIALMSLVSVQLWKKVNPKLLMLIATILVTGGCVLTGMTSNLLFMNILAVCRGIGAGIYSFVPLNMIMQNWFVKKIGFLTSIMASFSGIMGALGAPVFTWLIALSNWRIAFIAMGILLALMNLPVLLLPFSFHPSQLGMQPYGAQEYGVIPEKLEKKEKKKISFGLTFYCMAVIAFIHTMMAGFVQLFPSISVAMNMSASLGAMMLSAAMIGNIVFKMIFGALMDKIGAFKCALVAFSQVFISIIGVYLSLMARNAGLVLFFCFTMGGLYMMGAFGFSLVSHQLMDEDEYQAGYPIIGFLAGLANGVAITFFSLVYDSLGSYIPGFLICNGILIACALLIFIAKANSSKALEQKLAHA
jgi:MFS family permease